MDNFLVKQSPSSRLRRGRIPELNKPPSSRAAGGSSKSGGSGSTTPAKSSRGKRARATSSTVEDVDATPMAFGGADVGGTSAANGGAEEPAKKRWKPRADVPPNRGNKERPIGAADCLDGKVFVITGILDSLLREECVDLVKEYGGRVVSAPSGRVTHAIVGLEPGESKMTKLRKLKTPIIDEDGLFAMINETREEGEAEQKAAQERAEKEEEEMRKELEEAERKRQEEEAKKQKKGKAKKGKGEDKVEVEPKAEAAPANPALTKLWVDKYRPTEPEELVANPKILRDLGEWLSSWKSNFLHGDGHSRKLKDRRDSDYAAALLCGPPGIGKTTAAHVVCRQHGFEPLEFNASDVRNKGSVSGLADTVMVANSMSKFLKITPGAAPSTAGKAKASGSRRRRDSSEGSAGDGDYPNGQALIMDEVDGMSGGDRGGNAELIKLIKSSRIPVICIANDDSTQKMRSLAGSCFKLKFRRPMASQVTKRLLDIARREGFRHIDDKTVQKLAEGCNGDIRQMINLLQTWRSASRSLSYGDVKERLNTEGKTNIQRSIFDLAMSFFRPGADGSVNSLQARTDNYFADADLVPLFVQENYIHTAAAGQSLNALADAAESIADGDLCNSIVRREQRWDLMPSCAVLSSIRPGAIVAGGLNAQPMFPSFFGALSKGNKWKRIIAELEMKLKAASTSSGSVRAFRLDYIPALTTCLATPLINGGAAGVDDVIERLDAYYLEKDPDWTDILESGVYAKGRAPLDVISGPAKSALAREYKTSDHARSTVTGVHFGAGNRKKGGDDTIRKSAANAGDVGVVDEDPESGDEDNTVSKGDDDDVSQFEVKKKGKRPASSASGSSSSKKAKRRASRKSR